MHGRHVFHVSLQSAMVIQVLHVFASFNTLHRRCRPFLILKALAHARDALLHSIISSPSSAVLFSSLYTPNFVLMSGLRGLFDHDRKPDTRCRIASLLPHVMPEIGFKLEHMCDSQPLCVYTHDSAFCTCFG